MVNEVIIRGAGAGNCNICGEYGALTEDHTPPKGCAKPRNIEIGHIGSRLTLNSSLVKPKFSQNGLKYQTICSNCNNDILGRQNDPALIDFTKSVCDFLYQDQNTWHFDVKIKGCPQKIMRSVLGHICAQGVDRCEEERGSVTIKNFVLDKENILSDEIEIYYWFYPHSEQVLARDFGYMDIPTQSNFTVWLLKFFPLGFMITWNRPSTFDFLDHSISLHRISDYRHENYDSIVDLPVQLYPIQDQSWPEAPTNRSAILLGADAVYSKNR